MLAEIPGVTGVVEAAGVGQAIEALHTLALGTVVLDVHLRGESGLVVIPLLKRGRPGPLLIVVTNEPTDALRREAMALGADHFFDKSRDVEDLMRVISEAATPTRRFETSDQ
jgi:two-component system, OmpR family, response regulator